jgi:hypothetical protein
MATDATQHDWQIWIDYEPFEKERLGNRYRGFWHAWILVLYNGTPDSDGRVTVPRNTRALALSAPHRNGRNHPKCRFYPILNHPPYTFHYFTT